MRLIFCSIFLLIVPLYAFEKKSITIDFCYEQAKANYPLIKQHSLLQKTEQYNINNANKGYLPQLSLSVKTTYQSHVTKLPIVLPGLTIPELAKNQYQAVIEATQIVWDGGVIASQKKLNQAETMVEKQKLEVELFGLRERINQLFFGILLLNEQLKQIELLENELHTNYHRIVAYKQQGVANQSDVDAIQVEKLNATQRTTELQSTSKAYRMMLSTFIGMQIDTHTTLITPSIDTLLALQTEKNFRPEMTLFNTQETFFEKQKKMLQASHFPNIGLFLQAGYGRPGLNMLTNEFSAFYLAGIRLQWNIGRLYTLHDNTNKLRINQQTVATQKETFLFNSNLKTQQQQVEIEKLQSILVNDDQIIQLRENIKKSAVAKLENGIIAVSDIVREIQAENQARQLKALHQMQLIMAIYQLKNTVNQ